MKFYNIKDIDSFFDEDANCKGQVEIMTKEGDRLNLKSQLAKIIAYANIFSGGNIPEMELLVSDPEDMERLIEHVITDKKH